jgi:hypothetical protein
MQLFKDYIKHEAKSVVDVFKEEMNFKTGDGPDDYLYMFKCEGAQYVFDGIIDEPRGTYLLLYICLSDAIHAV